MNLIWGLTILLALGFLDHVTGQQEDPAVTNFREFLRIPTVHPNPQPGYGIPNTFSFKSLLTYTTICYFLIRTSN